MESDPETLTVDVSLVAGACKDTSELGEARPVLWPIASKRKRDDTDLECMETLTDIDFDADTSILEPSREAHLELQVEYYSHVFSEGRFFCPIIESATEDIVIPETPLLSDFFLE